MSPTRRTFLRYGGLIAAGAVAGCVSGARPVDDPLDSDGSNETDDPAGGTRPAGTGGPGVTLGAVDDAPDLPVVPSVEVTEDTATADHPPQLAVTVSNEGDEAVHVGEGRAVVFAYVTDDTDDLILLPADGEYRAEADCWRLAEPVMVTMEYRLLELEAGEDVTQHLDLYGTADGEGCLPVGEYRFEATYNVSDGPGEAQADREQAAWGFSIHLE